MDCRKATIKQIQVLTGSLNFLTRAIVPGRVFTRGMYTKLCHTDSRGRVLKDHHHVRIDKEFKEDCKVWTKFLEQDTRGSNLCQPFLDINKFEMSDTLNFYSDASGKIGFGAIFNDHWMFGHWNEQFLKDKPSIGYQELFGLCAVLLTWGNEIRNTQIVVFCDNQ